MIFNGKVQIIATPRSGSNYLHDLTKEYMNVCPLCVNDDYVKSSSPFSLNKGDDQPDQRIKGKAIYKRIEAINKGLPSIWKTHPYFMESEVFNFKGFNIKTNLELSDYNVLLTRRNILEVVLSAAIAREKGAWQHPFDDREVYIAPEEFKAVCKEIYFGHYLNLVENPRNIKVSDVLFYEENIVEQPPEEIFSNLSLCGATKDELPKISNPEVLPYKAPPKEQIIKNYNQLVDIAKEQYVENCIADTTDMITIDDNCYITEINLESYKK
jgi:hypothetical protein